MLREKPGSLYPLALERSRYRKVIPTSFRGQPKTPVYLSKDDKISVMKGRRNFPKKKARDEEGAVIPYTILPIHTRPASERIWDQGFYQIISIDPGIKHLGVRAERRYLDGHIEPLYFFRASFSGSEEGAMIEILDVLLGMEPIFETTHIVLIEEQYFDNTPMIRLSQVMETFFTLKLKNLPLLPYLVKVDNKLKLKNLGIESGLAKHKYKRELVVKAHAILTLAGDLESVRVLEQAKKRKGVEGKDEDLADATCQIEAWFIEVKLKVIPTTSEVDKIVIPS